MEKRPSARIEVQNTSVDVKKKCMTAVSWFLTTKWNERVRNEEIFVLSLSKVDNMISIRIWPVSLNDVGVTHSLIGYASHLSKHSFDESGK